ncbi:MAG: carboxypeptidase-like regulatory domain-containing protein [Saprospiraceae bacterium]|nr:carboxypeptidase-like regulatory domain-containing protein [Saprospiraceae bacterium]
MKAILPKLSLFLLSIFPSLLLAQLSGKVLDENGEPLPFASVYVRNSTTGTTANANGEYRLPLAPGDYEVVYQYIGYQQHIEQVKMEKSPVRRDVTLQASNLEITEVVITTEDPAVRIMRNVIERRKYYRNRVPDYSCDVYIKGFHKLMDAPDKIMGEEVGDMGGILDTNRTGVLYLSESVSKLYVQSRPERTREVMVSSKVSGRDNGFSLNRATLTDFNLYDEHLEIDREILSPLADNAFNYYNFKLLGKYKDENGYDIYKISVIPRRVGDPTFSGNLYVVDEWWNLAGVDLALTGAAIKQPVLDTLRIVQEFVPVERPDKWCLLSQVTTFKFGVFGFKIQGLFNSVFSGYNIKPQYESGFFGRETFKIEKDAPERDSLYWEQVRPVPLTAEESRDYVRKDSLQKIWESKAYLDSTDRKDNKFKLNNLLFGYTWRNSYKKISVSYPAALQWIQFNTVQGWALNVQPEFSRYEGERRNKFWRAEGTLNYGFSEKKFRAGAKIQRRFESVRYSNLEVSGGVLTSQFNPNDPISPAINTSYSLFDRRNYLKLYEKSFGRVEWSQYATPGIFLRARLEYANRRPLINNSTESWTKKADHRYTSNDPLFPEGPNEPSFEENQAFIFGLTARFRFGQTYSTYPDFRSYDDTPWPDVFVQYRKAIAGVAGSDANFDYVSVQIRQDHLSWGLGGYTDWNVVAGMFIQKERLAFMDFHHANGNQTFLNSPVGYTNSYYLLPYYAYSTDQPFVEAHVQHHLQGWLLDKIPLVRKLNWKEVIGLNFYWTEQAFELPDYQRQLPYWEAAFGFENIGFDFFRPFRVHIASAFFGGNYYKTGVQIGMNF